MNSSARSQGNHSTIRRLTLPPTPLGGPPDCRRYRYCSSKQLWQRTDIYVVLSKNQVLLNPLVQHWTRKELGEVSGCRTLHGIHTWRIPVSWTAWKPGDPRSIEMILHPAYPAMAHCHSSQGLLKSGIQPICCPPGYVARLPLNHVLEVWMNTRNIAYNSQLT